MTFVDRMTDAGIPLECAEKIAAFYISQGDIEGLEAYVIALEAAHEVQTL